MAEANTPNWLSNDNNNDIGNDFGNSGVGGGVDVLASDRNTTTTSTSVPMAGGSTEGSTTGSTDDDTQDLPSVILTMRLLNMGVSIYVITISIINLLSLPSLSVLVLSVYAICGGLLVCLLETQLKFLRVAIALNFGFLFNSVWRLLFYVLLGSVCYSFGGLLGMIGGIAFFCIALFNTYVLCRYPSYRKIRERIAEEEDKRIEARISKEVKKQATRQIMKT